MPGGTVDRETELVMLKLAVPCSGWVGEWPLNSFAHSADLLGTCFMLAPSYHSGFSLNVTSLGKPLTSETRPGPSIILS